MSFEDLTTGAVIRYPFLWSHEAMSGATEGRKTRPAAVGFRVPRKGGDILLMFPITSKQPAPERFAFEIPQIEKRRAGLDVDLRLWVNLDEFNENGSGRSFYLEPEPPMGRLSRAFLAPILRAFIARRESLRGVRRSEN